MIGEPTRFSTALEFQSRKRLLPTELKSAEISKIDAAIRERALFSARTANAEYVSLIDETLQALLISSRETPLAKLGFERAVGPSDARVVLGELLEKIGYAPEKPGTIEDLGSDQRLNLIVDTQTSMARGFGSWQSGQTDGALDEFPAQELYRAESRKEPRNWPERWKAAGGEFYDGPADYSEGRMIARKDDPIWETISAFGQPYPPFDFNSGMGVKSIDRQEATELGIITEEEQVTPKRRNFNDGLEASSKDFPVPLREALLKSLGPGYGFQGDVLKRINNRRKMALAA